ncbi:hypothetical protein ENKO_43720 (plasmid) [Enterobacter kobei]|uniref:Uncharacterized protein n=1 Tax=Enterobacter kobei TaxID=208224 RepID=A0AA86MB07_9ENTR|nr:hypothetical protein ENKO_43720 [Enterobacter kobei]
MVLHISVTAASIRHSALADFINAMQLLRGDHLKKQNQKIKDAGPLRLPVFAGSSSPTAPGPLLRTGQSPPDPCGFRA